ncbi:MAG: lipopolysaccharide biosynthesis protein [Cyclonatronaceae bacterium]
MNELKGLFASVISQLVRKSDFVTNITKLAGGTGIAQVIPFMVLPLLSRIYTPAEFGWFGVYYAVALVTSVFITGKYELAILLPDSKREANHLTRLAEMLTIGAGLVTFVVVFFLHRPIASLLSVEPVAWLLMLLPVSIISLALLQVYSYRLNRDKNYNIISSGKIVYSVVLAISQIGLGYLGFTVTGLIFGSILAILAHVLTLRFWNRSVFEEKEPYDKSLLKELALTYIDFPKHNAPHSLTSALSVQIPVVLLNRFLGEAIAGLYLMAFRIVQAPVMLISTSIGQVYSQTISEMYRQGGNIHTFTLKLYFSLTLLGFVPFTLLAIWGPEIFTFVLGNEWSEAGRYARFFSPAFFMVFIVSPTIFITALLNKQKKAFQFELIFIILRLSGLSLGIYLQDPIIAVACYSAATMLMMLFYIRWLLKLTKGAVRKSS